jgi:PAS domain S-box-containing protein
MFVKRLLIFLLAWSTLLGSGTALSQNIGSDSALIERKERRIMLIFSKERNNERVREFGAGFSTYNSNKKTNLRITNLHLNSEGDRSKEDMIRVMNMAWKAYSAQVPDLVIATDSEALEVLLSLDATHKTLPRILCVKLLDSNYKLISGISYVHTSFPIIENIELGMKLFPDSKEVTLITDNSTYGYLEAEYAKRVAGQLAENENVKISYLSPKGDNFEDFVKKINGMPLKSFAILSSWMMDNNGNYLIKNSPNPFLSKINNIPVLGVQNLLTGTGVLGGYTISSWDHGYKTAEFSSEMLDNPGLVINDTINQYKLQFDFNEVKRWNIPGDKISKQAIMINKPESIYDNFRTEVQLFLAFILLLVTTLMVFAVYHFRHRNLNKELMRLSSENIARRELLNNTFSVMEEGVISFDKNLNIIYANDAATQLSEYKRGLMGKKFHEVFKTSQPESSDCIHSLLKQSLVQKITISIPEYSRIDYHEKESRFIAGNISPVLDKTGEVSQLVLVMRDVTELYKQRRYLNLAMESAKAFIWFYSTLTKQFSVVVNKENIFGQENDGFTTHKNFLELVHPEDREKLSLSYDKLMTRKAKSFSVEYRMSLNGGSKWEWWERRGIIYSVSSGTANKDARFLYGMDININDIKLRENELVEARLKAEESDRLKSSFLSNMSHEIRTPLNGIVGFANLISDSTYSESEKVEFASIINNNSASLMTLINDILDISRIESNSLKFEFSNFDLSNQIIEVAETSKLNLKKSLTILTELPFDNESIFYDEVRNRQVISNLVNNAVKFTEEGTITIGFIKRESEIEIFVKDTGRGISPEDIEKVFNRFYKTDEFAPGTGLGLPICKAIVERLGGSISVTSIVGEGTRVFYTIPLDLCSRIKNNENLVAESPANITAAASTNEIKKRILIAEDLDSNFMLLDIILSRTYDIARALNGQEAIDLFDSYKPDIILMDIKMPVMNGLEATKAIRKKSTVIPIIALTANAFESDLIEAREAGCNDVLTKPVKAAMLSMVVEKYIYPQN